jgi:hypothetical protein
MWSVVFFRHVRAGSLFLHVANACHDIGLLKQLDMRTVRCIVILSAYSRCERCGRRVKFYAFCCCCLYRFVSFRHVTNAPSGDMSSLLRCVASRVVVN